MKRFDPDKMRLRFQHVQLDNGRRYTSCVIMEDGEPIAVGYAICSKKESFNKERGRTISQGRAIKSLETGKEIATRAGGTTYFSGKIKEEQHEDNL